MQEGLPKLIAVVGPTASGKTKLALRLARQFGGEIVSADSRQFYRGMEIGSDTVRGTMKNIGGYRAVISEGIPHHLTSFRSPADPVTAGGFVKLAKRRIRSILKRGKIPFVVGGTGLYVQALLDNFTIPKVVAHPEIRTRLERRSTASLYASLEKKDPEYAVRIPKENRRYIIRALEVMEVTGVQFSVQQRTADPVFDALQIGIARPREEMYLRIDARVDLLMGRGLLQETKRLGKRYGWEPSTMSGLGHKQLGMYLRGEISLERAVELIKRDTRRFGKRQLTWFRRDPRIRWVKGYGEAKPLVNRFLKGK